MRHFGKADSVVIEEGELGFYLTINTDEGDRFVFTIQSLAEEFFANVQDTIGPWIQERDDAKDSYDPGLAVDARDTKNPDWHSVHSDLYDLREKG